MSKGRTGWRASNNPTILRPKGEWRKHNGGVYRYMVYLTPKEEGGFSAAAARLPGVASQGGTEQEALANIVEAFKGALARYKEQGVDVPWMKTPLEPDRGAVARWVIVHA